MVSYKGFNVNVASQIDAHPLPEFSTAQGLGPSSTVACYIPIYPGAQIWIEYSVDRPQPSEAIYLFKLFISSQFVTSWVGVRMSLQRLNTNSIRTVHPNMASKGKLSTACIQPNFPIVQAVLLDSVHFNTVTMMPTFRLIQETTV